MLREEGLKKDALIEKIKKEHIAVVSDLEERCTHLTHQNSLIQLQAEKDLKQYV